MKNNNTILEGAKLPPQALDLEEVVLGALMIESSSFSLVEDFLKPESFYVDAHQKIYKAIQKLFRNNSPTDFLMVMNELKKSNELEIIGGHHKLATLTGRVASSANIEFHARIIEQKFIERELIRISSEVIRDAYEGNTDVFDMLENAERRISELGDQKGVKDFASPIPIIQEIMRKNETLLDKTKTIGVPSGFHALDTVTAGWQKSDLIVLAGRPGMGKTAFALSIAINSAISGNPVALFSIEMSSVQITSRALSIVSEVPLNYILRQGVQGLDMKQLNLGISEYENLPIYIDDTGGISISELKKKARKAKKEKGVKIIFIDYLQLITDFSEKGANREQQISSISRQLKALAKELDVPIIALSQLSRSVEQRGGNKVPMLSDLRDSGAIEQDADMVIFLYRPEYYGMEDFEGMNSRGLAIAIIAKHRNGALEDVRLGFKDSLTKFVNYGEPDSYSNSQSIKPNNDFDKPF